MRFSFTLSGFSAAVMLAFSFLFPLQAMAATPAETAAGIQAFYGSRSDFAAEFSQEVARPHLPDRPLKKRGRLFFKKPGLMRWDYLEPDNVFYISDGKILWNYIPESALAYKLVVEDSELFFALRFLYGEGDLAKDFNLSQGEQEQGLDKLILKPKAGEQNFKEVQLLFDPVTFEIKQTIVIDPADNKSRVVFEKVSYGNIDPAGFNFTPPKGVRVEDLSKTAVPGN
jgi:outer membrane lipoprotein carrier protein